MKCITKLTATLFTVATLAAGLAWAQPGGGANQQWEYDSIITEGFAAYVPCLGDPFLW